jgi:hypothetical protein
MLQKDYISNKGQTIVFDSTFVIIGNHYNTTTGIFTCPFDGYYIFSLFQQHNQAEAIGAYMLIDGVWKHGFSVNSNDSTSQGGNAAVLPCLTGQQVWVQGFGDNEVLGNFKWASTFSGTFLSVIQLYIYIFN